MQSHRIRKLHGRQHPDEMGRHFHHSRIGKGAVQKWHFFEKQHEMGEAQVAKDYVK